MDELIRDFENKMHLEGKSEKTIKIYVASVKEFFRWFNEKKDKLDIAATYTLFYNGAILVEQGVGYMFTLNNLANTSKISNLCFRPLKTNMKASWGLIWKKYQVFSPAAKLFLGKVQEKFADK